MSETRKDGFYWVRLFQPWEIAMWDGTCWQFAHRGLTSQDNQLAEIGPQVTREANVEIERLTKQFEMHTAAVGAFLSELRAAALRNREASAAEDTARLVETLKSDAAFLRRFLGQLISVPATDERGEIVNRFAAAQIPDWEIRQRLEDIDQDIDAARGVVQPQQHEFAREIDLGPGFGMCMICRQPEDHPNHAARGVK